MQKNPYVGLPSQNFWKNTVSKLPWTEVFLGQKGKFFISPDEKVATAGSCFAQRISKILKNNGFNFAEFEFPHPLVSNEIEIEKMGYGRFSARYGNIYTPLQLRQLLDEAFENQKFSPKVGISKRGRYLDLRRPNINSIGFSNEEEALADRAYHLACVKKMFLEMDVFVFTLGLTEAWIDDVDGIVYGTHPSVALGSDWIGSASRVNFDYVNCFNDMVYVINFVQSINPKCRFLLTVSPVALAATHQDQHVLLSTCYSKSVLRSVAGKLRDISPIVDYFFSFEIFSVAQSFGQFLSDDLRDVNGRGIDLAMKLFCDIYCNRLSQSDLIIYRNNIKNFDMKKNYSSVGVECDEVMNAFFDEKPD